MFTAYWAVFESFVILLRIGGYCFFFFFVFSGEGRSTNTQWFFFQLTRSTHTRAQSNEHIIIVHCCGGEGTWSDCNIVFAAVELAIIIIISIASASRLIRLIHVRVSLGRSCTCIYIYVGGCMAIIGQSTPTNFGRKKKPNKLIRKNTFISHYKSLPADYTIKATKILLCVRVCTRIMLMRQIDALYTRTRSFSLPIRNVTNVSRHRRRMMTFIIYLLLMASSF